MKKLYLMFFTMLVGVCMAFTGYSQVTIWEEDFTYADETNSGSGSGMVTGSWTSEIELPGPDGVYVSGNRLIFEDADGGSNDDFNLSLDISGYCDVTFTLNYGSNSVGIGDDLDGWYSIDGGNNWTQFISINIGI